MNILDLPGPEFLRLYLVLAGVAVVLTWALRWLLRGPYSLPAETPPLEPYEVAYLGGGPELAVNAAIASLIRSGLLKGPRAVHMPERRIERGSHKAKRLEDRPPLETKIYEAIPDGGVSLERLHDDVRPLVEELAGNLRQRDLLLSAEHAAGVRWVSLLPLLAVLGLGITKVFVGLSQSRPVGFLVALCMGVAILTWLVGRRRLWRTVRGDRVLRALRQENAALDYMRRHKPRRLTQSDLVLALGLFGLGVLASGALQRFRQLLSGTFASAGTRRRAAGSSAAAGSSCGSGCGSSWSSCSGSSCSSGSSCGGGCGGGGCGGCGGG